MIPALLIFLPFPAGIAGFVIALRSERGRYLTAVLFCWGELLLSVLLVILAVRGRESSLLQLRIPHVLSLGLSFQTDGFRAVYSLVTSLMWAFTTTFSLEYFRHERENLSRYYLFVLFTLGATQGVMLSGDLMTTFLFFEILSMTSFTWVMHEETEGALRAGYTYLFIAVIGGLVLFMGLVLLYHAAGTLTYSDLCEAVKTSGADSGTILAAGVCILIGFGCKAGMFPVHVWLPKAHPVAPSPASALLSGVLTKVGIYGILMTGLEVLIDSFSFGWIVLLLGSITMFLGAVLALFSINLKRTLACSSMSQIGFILTGIGMTILLHTQHASHHALAEAALSEAHEGAAGMACLEGHALAAMSGTVLHMVNHSMLKLCLFCAAGVVVMNLHELDLNRIRGWGRGKWILMVSFFLGVIGIGGVPLFNGYASKTLLHEAITAGIAEAGEGIAIPLSAAGVLSVIEWVFLISGGCTFAYMLKLFICVFLEKNSDAKRQEDFDKDSKGYMHAGGIIAVFLTSLLFVALGQKPVFNALASFMTGHGNALEEFAPLSFECVKGALISLGIGTVLYVGFIRRVLMKKGQYLDLWPAWLDLENLFYRPLLTRWLPGFFGAILSVPAENRILSRVCPGIVRCAGSAAAVFAENKVLIPVSRWILLAISLIVRILSVSTDALIVFLRRTILKERVITDKSQRLGLIRKRTDEIREAYEPIAGNFSFALMLSCIGIMVILGVIMYSIL